MNSPSTYDGRRPEPAYETEMDRAISEERERCAQVAETLVWSMSVSDWILMTKRQISERAAREIAAAIRA